MKNILFGSLLLLGPYWLQAQLDSRSYRAIAVMNTQTKLPFSQFAGLFYKAFHPGLEFTAGKNFRVKNKHDWYYDIRLAYFYHRFVQHGFPVYSNLGYRYRLNTRWSVFTEAGAGYFHSLPSTAKLRLNDAGQYQNNKGIGRAQANACFGIGTGYRLHPAKNGSSTLFMCFQQRVQFPFVKSYVPVLPYTGILFGISRPVSGKKHK